MFNTNRCIIRSFIQSDIEAFMSYRNNLDWMKYQGFKGLSEKEYEIALLKKSTFYEGKQLAIVLKDSNQLIGDLYVKNESGDYWIGYSIAPSYARRGLTSEVVNDLMLWLDDHYLVKRFLAGVDKENNASIKLLEKVGFVFDHYDQEFKEFRQEVSHL